MVLDLRWSVGELYSLRGEVSHFFLSSGWVVIGVEMVHEVSGVSLPLLSGRVKRIIFIGLRGLLSLSIFRCFCVFYSFRPLTLRAPGGLTGRVLNPLEFGLVAQHVVAPCLARTLTLHCPKYTLQW